MSYLDNIPSALQMHPKWMVCSADGSKWEKTPIDPVEGYAVEGRGKNNPEVWLSFEDAREWTRVGTRMMGFICTADDEYTIIDLDDINNLKGKHTEESLERQQAILTWAYENGCYGEWSKSGNGCHIVVKGKLTGNVVKQSQIGFEAYGHNCEYIIITGRKIEGFGNEPISLPAEWINYFNQFVSGSNSEWNEQHDGVSAEFLAKMDSEYSYDEQKLYTEKWKVIEGWQTGGKYERFRLGLDIGQPGEDASANDFDCLQACYSVLRGHQERPLAAARMFMALERADRIKRGEKNKAYLLQFSLPSVIARVDAKEQKESMEREGWREAVGRIAANGQMQAADGEAITSSQAPNMKLAPQPKPGANGGWKYADGVQSPEFKFLTPEELKALPKLEWVLKGIFHKKSVNAIYGWSAVGKSFLAIDLIAAIAEGREWFGRYTRQCNVDYLALEGAQGMQQRVKAYEKGTGKEYPQNVEFYPGRFNLLDITHVEGLIAQRQQTKGGVVVIDTFSKGTPGINENDAGEMAKAVAHLEIIKEQLEACVIVIHHSTKLNDGKQGMMRGSGVLQAGLDGVISVAMDEEGIRKWKSDKVKEGQSDNESEFDLEVIKVDTEIDPISGEVLDIESCYIKPAYQVNPNANRGAPVPIQHKEGDQAPWKASAPHPPVATQRKQNGSSNGSSFNGSRSNRSTPDGSRNGKDKQLLRDSLTSESIKPGNGRTDIEGMTEGSTAVPFTGVLNLAAFSKQGSDPVQSKKDLKRALIKMIDTGELGQWTESVDGKPFQWIWNTQPG